VLVVVH